MLIFTNLFTIVVVTLMVGLFIWTIFKVVSENIKDSNSEEVTVHCKVVEKVGDTSGSTDNRVTRYYVTFETDKKERIVLQLKVFQYSNIIEGDIGTLKYQRKRFNSFTLDS